MQPTEAQLAALARFQTMYGRNWKAHLRCLWQTDAAHLDGALLRQLRNNFGPEWLAKYRPGDTRVAWLERSNTPDSQRGRYLLVDADGMDMVQPWCASKSEARLLAHTLKITLLE